jgi:hypothetical protein
MLGFNLKQLEDYHDRIVNITNETVMFNLETKDGLLLNTVDDLARVAAAAIGELIEYKKKFTLESSHTSPYIEEKLSQAEQYFYTYLKARKANSKF